MIQKKQNDTDLTDKQLQSIPLILSAKNISGGVKKAKISRVTFYRWMESPVFRAAFLKQRDLIVDQALHDMKVASKSAVKVLISLLKDNNPNIRLKASLEVLQHIERTIKYDEFEKRLSTMEGTLLYEQFEDK